MSTQQLLEKASSGFRTLGIGREYQQTALKFLKEWLAGDSFQDYQPQIEHLITSGYWDYLLDSFYQVIPFGTGGRRGEVGIGPNRINPWTIKASAQGHSQYLLKHYGEAAKERGVVFAYDVRAFFGNEYLDDNLPNPVRGLTARDLATSAAEVYAANGIKVYVFDNIRTTPELSFAVRKIGAVAGDVFSASHNPPSHNGKKVYDEFGGQLVPPDDEALVDEVTKRVKGIKHLDYEKARRRGLIVTIPKSVDEAYVEAASSVSLSKARDIDIVYTPLHGCGHTSVTKALRGLGFKVKEDPKTSNPSGKFGNITFNIPNPEVVESFDTPLKCAEQENADILLNSDPDADRVGVMVKHHGEWRYLNGNEIAAILTEYVTSKRSKILGGQGVVIKTTVTTNLISEICKKKNLSLIGELLVGFKYVGAELNKLEENGDIGNFLVACEESNGYLAGNYARDKDAVTAAIWLSELAAALKEQSKTLVDYLNEIYAQYGYFRNYLTEIRLLGAEGNEKIHRIQHELRKRPPKSFGSFRVKYYEDCLQRKPIVSKTDRSSKDVLIYKLEPLPGTTSLKVTVRPSGTEPKTKMYFEIGTEPAGNNQLAKTKREVEQLLQDLERDFMKACYKIIDVEFPDRGFLLFWQLPLDDKMRYFEIEPAIAKLRSVKRKVDRQKKLNDLLSFLGADPITKIDKAWQAKYGQPVDEYLKLR